MGLAFALDARIALEEAAAAAPAATRDLTLPPLRTVAYAPGRTQVRLLVRPGWDRLQRAAAKALVGREFTAGTPLGEARLTPTSVVVSGVRRGESDGAAIGFSIGFEAHPPGTRRPVRGTLHLAAVPTVDAGTDVLRLDDVRVSPILDGALWSRLGPLVETRVVAALRERGRVDLRPWLDEIETRLAAQLDDPARTAGLAVRAGALELGIGRLAAERAGLAIEVEASADVDVDVPEAVLATLLAR